MTSVIAGRMAAGARLENVAEGPSTTTAGNTGRMMAKTSTSTVATTNSGMLIPIRAISEMLVSVPVPRREAAQIPSRMDPATPTTIAGPAMRRVFPNACHTVGATGSPETRSSRSRRRRRRRSSPRTVPRCSG